MKRKSIQVLSTGGTIAMGMDEKSGGAVQKLSGEGLLQGIPSLRDTINISVMDVCSKPGPHMTPQDIFRMSGLIKQLFNDEKVDGVVVTHGTDTIEETAYMLDLLIDNDNPIVITGAMRNTSLLSPDGPANLNNAILTAASEDARGKGTMVVFNDEVHLGREVTKSSSTQLNTFRSPLFGPVGFIYANKVQFVRERALREFIPAIDVSAQVELIKFTQGMDTFLLDAVQDKRVDGVIFEAAGVGHTSIPVAEKLQELVENGKPVILTSRCYESLVLGDAYAFEGSEKDLHKRGLIFAPGLSGQKARIKLILALSLSRDLEQIRRIFDEPVRYGD